MSKEAEKSENVVAMEVEESEEDKQERLKQESIALAIADIKNNFTFLERAVETIESRFTTRVLRTTTSIRKRLTPYILTVVINDYFGEDQRKNVLLSYLGEQSDVSMKDTTDDAKKEITRLPEIEIYLNLLVMIYLLDNSKFEQGTELAKATVEQVEELNRRTLDQLTAKVYFYYVRFHELTDRLAEIRPILLAAQRTATLRRDDDTQATLLNLLLRNYFHYNLYEQADKLVSKSTFPENASNNQAARYAYYLGRIRALQLDYTEAHTQLLQAIRKAPQNTATAGFQQTANKFFIIVQLLMGEIPERSMFRQPVLRKALLPYLHITQAVRIGDLNQFQEGLAKYGANFKRDKTYTLILRLRHNVIKTGIRMISLSYSRISLRDICIKLHLDGEEDAEFIVAKSIKDGVIDAVLDHDGGYMRSKESADVYSTNEPQGAFHQRVSFCLNLHNESIKAMRFPLNAHRKELDNVQEALERERELAQEIAEGDLDEDDDMGDF